MIVALKLPSESIRQRSQTAPPHVPRKVRPLAVRSGDMLALKMVRGTHVPAADAAGNTTKTRAPEEFSLRR
jgi:hypothetical protein